jgi:hypothetical protein
MKDNLVKEIEQKVKFITKIQNVFKLLVNEFFFDYDNFNTFLYIFFLY